MIGIWEQMRGIYRKMGLTEEEICQRIICKGTMVTNHKLNLDKCDLKRKEVSEKENAK